MKILLPVALGLFFAGCASTFKPVNREGLQLKAASLSPEIDFAYSRNALIDSRNAKYERKATSTRTDIVAVTIRNKTDHPLPVRDSLAFFSGSQMVEPAPAASAIRRIRQIPGMYCLYLVMMPINIYGGRTECTNGDCHSSLSIIPIGAILGPVLAGINAAIASSANDGFRKEIAGHDLSDTTLAPGETATGYLVFQNAGKKNLTARLKSATALPPPTAPDPFEEEDAPPARARDFR